MRSAAGLQQAGSSTQSQRSIRPAGRCLHGAPRRALRQPCPAALRHARRAAPAHQLRAASSDQQWPGIGTLAVTGKFISKTEVPAFIPRADMMQQLYRWAVIEAGEGGQRNFGLPMIVQPKTDAEGDIWGFDISIIKEGIKLTDIAVGFDLSESVNKYEWVGRGEDGFPVPEGRVTDVQGKFFEIWKLDSTPVDEDLRSTIRSLCVGLVAALNKYYAFGSVFAEEV